MRNEPIYETQSTHPILKFLEEGEVYTISDLRANAENVLLAVQVCQKVSSI